MLQPKDIVTLYEVSITASNTSLISQVSWSVGIMSSCSLLMFPLSVSLMSTLPWLLGILNSQLW